MNNPEDEDDSDLGGSTATSGRVPSIIESESEVLPKSGLEGSHIAYESERSADEDWVTAGHMAQASYSESAQNRDWALIEVRKLSLFRPELAETSNPCRYEVARAIGGEFVSIGAGTGSYHRVCKSHRRVVLPSGRTFNFVDVQVLESVDGKGESACTRIYIMLMLIPEQTSQKGLLDLGLLVIESGTSVWFMGC